jgi:transcriptional regulator with XRE-family HTH domain
VSKLAPRLRVQNKNWVFVMNRLKELRTRRDLKQRDIAKRLGTTQQTVARWEIGITPIPVAQLKDLALLFGCTIDEFLGVEKPKRPRDPTNFTRGKKPIPWGTLSVHLGARRRDYPIDEGEYEQLKDWLQRRGLDGLEGWICFEAMDNRSVLLNPTFISRLGMISDGDEAMPPFASYEAYKSVTDATPIEQLGPALLEERSALIRHLRRKQDSAEVTPEDEEEAQKEMDTVRVLYGDGRSEEFFLNDDTVTSLSVFEANSGEVPRNALILVNEDDDNVAFVNCSAVAAMEIPLQAYLASLSRNVPAENLPVEI